MRLPARLLTRPDAGGRRHSGRYSPDDLLGDSANHGESNPNTNAVSMPVIALVRYSGEHERPVPPGAEGFLTAPSVADGGSLGFGRVLCLRPHHWRLAV
jgi:hypothetical protein